MKVLDGSAYLAGPYRADAAWKAAGLKRITLHECRHTFASLLIAAGVNAKALSTYVGHADIATTFNKYGPVPYTHLTLPTILLV